MNFKSAKEAEDWYESLPKWKQFFVLSGLIFLILTAVLFVIAAVITIVVNTVILATVNPIFWFVLGVELVALFSGAITLSIMYD